MLAKLTLAGLLRASRTKYSIEKQLKTRVNFSVSVQTATAGDDHAIDSLAKERHERERERSESKSDGK